MSFTSDNQQKPGFIKYPETQQQEAPAPQPQQAAPAPQPQPAAPAPQPQQAETTIDAGAHEASLNGFPYTHTPLGDADGVDELGDYLDDAFDKAKTGDIDGVKTQLLHPKAAQAIANREPRLKLSPEERDKLAPQAYFAYLDSIPTSKERRLTEEYDEAADPFKMLNRRLINDPMLGFLKGFGDTAGRSQFYGLARSAIKVAGDDSKLTKHSLKIYSDKIRAINMQVAKGEKVFNSVSYKLGAMLGRNATQVAVAAYSGGSIPALFTLETGASFVDNVGKPKPFSKDVITPQGVGIAGPTALATGTFASGIGIVAKVLPYVFRGFQSKNIHDMLNPTTEIEWEAYEQMADMLEYATKHKIRLSEYMVRNSTMSEDGVRGLSGYNYAVVREMFKGSDDFARDSLNMLQDLLSVSSRQAEAMKGAHTVSEIRALTNKFRNETKALREKYRDEETVIWDKTRKLLPDEHVELDDFVSQVKAELTREGIDPSAVSTVERMYSARFKSGYKAIHKEIRDLEVQRDTIKSETEHYRTTKGISASAKERSSVLSDFHRKRLDVEARIKELKHQVRISPKDMLFSIQLINKKLNIPGGALSLKDANEMAGLRIAKAMMTKKLEAELVKHPKAYQAWQEAKDLTIQRVNSFGTAHNDTDLILTNALLSQNTGKVISMLSDPIDGLSHMNFIANSFGKDSAAFHHAAGLFLRAKMGLLEGAGALRDRSKPFSAAYGDFDKIAKKVGKISYADITFIKENVSPAAGADLHGYISLVNTYSKFKGALAIQEGGRGSIPAWQYVARNLMETKGGTTLLWDYFKYGMVKGSNKVLKHLPTERTLMAGGLVAIANSKIEEEEGKEMSTEEFYWNIIKGAGIGYASGIAGRHLFEEQIAEITRILVNRANKKPSYILKMVEKITENMRKIGKSLDNGTLKPTKYDDARYDDVTK